MVCVILAIKKFYLLLKIVLFLCCPIIIKVTTINIRITFNEYTKRLNKNIPTLLNEITNKSNTICAKR